MTLILGIESSCDESACAVVRDGVEVLSSAVASQIARHAAHGGVVPELAAREEIAPGRFGFPAPGKMRVPGGRFSSKSAPVLYSADKNEKYFCLSGCNLSYSELYFLHC